MMSLCTLFHLPIVILQDALKSYEDILQLLGYPILVVEGAGREFTSTRERITLQVSFCGGDRPKIA